MGISLENSDATNKKLITYKKGKIPNMKWWAVSQNHTSYSLICPASMRLLMGDFRKQKITEDLHSQQMFYF